MEKEQAKGFIVKKLFQHGYPQRAKLSGTPKGCYPF